MNLNKPILVEPGVKYKMETILKRCNLIKSEYYSRLYNLYYLLFFIIILGIILYFKYNGKQSDKEIYDNKIKKEEYIISKVNKLKIMNKEKRNELITNLPNW